MNELQRHKNRKSNRKDTKTWINAKEKTLDTNGLCAQGLKLEDRWYTWNCAVDMTISSESCRNVKIGKSALVQSPKRFMFTVHV